MHEHNILLQTIPLFAGIDHCKLEAMLKCIGSSYRKYTKNSFIFLEGDEIKQIGVLLSGRIAMIKEDAWGERSILTFIEQGGLLGETFVCSHEFNSTVSFQACSDSSILMMPFHKVVTTCTKVCGFHYRLIENMLVMMAEKNIKFIEKLEVNSKKNLRDKILTFLSQQSPKNGSSSFTVSFGRVEMADFLSADRSALTRELSRMKEEGLLEYDKNNFTLK